MSKSAATAAANLFRFTAAAPQQRADVAARIVAIASEIADLAAPMCCDVLDLVTVRME